MRTRFDFILTPEQFIKAAKRNHARLMRAMPTRWLIQISAGVLVAGLVFTLLYSFNLLQGRHAATIKPIWIAAVAMLPALLLNMLFYYQGLQRVLRRSNHLAGIPRTLAIEETGLRESNQHGETFTLWSGLMGVDEGDDVVLLLHDIFYFNPIPVNAFASAQEKDAFVAHVRERIASAAAPTSAIAPAAAAMQADAQIDVPLDAPQASMDVQPAVPSLTPDDAPSASPLPRTPAFSPATQNFFANLVQAFKLAFFVRVPQERISVSWGQIPAFALLSVLLSFVWAFFKVGFGGEFQWYSLPVALFHLPVLFLGAIFIAYASGRSEKTLLLTQVFLMISLALDMGMLALSGVFTQLPGRYWGRIFGASLFTLPTIWLALACFVAAVRYTLPNIPRRVVALSISAVLIALPLGMIYRQYSLWELPYDENKSNRASLGVGSEDHFYGQAKVLERELAAVQPERKGVTDVFFIGMAGYGGQDVFMKEVDAVARLFRERFDAEGHSLRLVNNNKSLAAAPIASATSLEASLKRVAQVMNNEEDILFLFLTSHGSETHRFSLELWPLSFKELDPMRLRKLLDESGIKHRVIVVSACYSGGFINALKDDNTLVISASAPDKNSFGCDNENDWTYFGNAYFNEALRNTFSFTEAFNIAKPVIAAREKKEDYEPSNPQMALGAAIGEKLATLEQQLSARRQTAEGAAGTQLKSNAP